MITFKIKLWLTLTVIGLLGVASLLFSELSLDNLPKQVTDSTSTSRLKLLMLVGPAFIVMIATLIGTLLYDKARLTVPVLEKLLHKPRAPHFSLMRIIKYGIMWGILSGGIIIAIGSIFEPYLPQTLREATSNIHLNVASKILYGGITEELLTRFGLVSLFTWIMFKLSGKLTGTIYWIAISLAALLFALGHLPVVFQTIPDPSWMVIVYIITGNTLAGLIFGYAYWKKGLECAFIAHAIAHVTMIILEKIL